MFGHFSGCLALGLPGGVGELGQGAGGVVDGLAQGDVYKRQLLNPTRVEEIGQVAANGEKMPQKSTYFYPKLITGLAMNDLETPAGL